MAKAAKAAAGSPPATYEPETKYRIQLSRAVKWGTVELRPGLKQIVVIGSVAQEIADAIISAEKV